MTLSKDDANARDPLFDMILRRQSNKRNYAETPLSADQLAQFRGTRIDPRLPNGFLSLVALINTTMDATLSYNFGTTLKHPNLSDDKRRVST